MDIPPQNQDFSSMSPQDTMQYAESPQEVPVDKPSFISRVTLFFQGIIAQIKLKLFHQKSQGATLGGSFMKKADEQAGMKWYDGFLIGKKDRLDFLEQLSTLLSSGIRLVDSLVIMKQQAESFSIKRLIEALIGSVRNGASLSQAMAQFPSFFPEKWVSLVHAGEKSGQLEQILLDLAQDEDDQFRLMSSLKSAMAYPMFVVVLTLGLVTYMLLVVVPEVSNIYAKLHQTLPAPTLFVIALAEFVKKTYIFILIALVFLIVGIKTSAHFFLQVRKVLDHIKLRIPVFGMLNRKQNVALFAGNMALLLKSGVLVVDALNIIKEVLPSTLYKEEIKRIVKGVVEGKKISQEMGLINLQKEEFIKNFYFPLQVSQLIHIGEETGSLANLLERIKKTYTNQINMTVKTFSSLLEPFMIIIVGVMVGGILLAVILPFFSIKM